MSYSKNIVKKPSYHFHKDENGFLVKCYHKTRNTLASGAFWLGLTISFPFEHFLWEKVWPFTVITKFLGL